MENDDIKEFFKQIVQALKTLEDRLDHFTKTQLTVGFSQYKTIKNLQNHITGYHNETKIILNESEKFYEKIKEFRDFFSESKIIQAFTEIKFIRKRLEEIEGRLYVIENQGKVFTITSNI